MLTVLVSALICAASATPALAATNPAVADCVAHGGLTHSYTAAQLQNGLTTMATDIKQYTDCYDVIQQALLAKLGRLPSSGAAPSGGSGGSFLPTPVIAVLIALALAAAGFGAVALRRRSGGGGQATSKG